MLLPSLTITYSTPHHPSDTLLEVPESLQTHKLLPLHRQPYLLKLVIPTTNALPHWRLNVEMKTKRTLYSSRRLSFNEITNTNKNLVLHSSHFALN